jgi:hypothetical protein
MRIVTCRGKRSFGGKHSQYQWQHKSVNLQSLCTHMIIHLYQKPIIQPSVMICFKEFSVEGPNTKRDFTLIQYLGRKEKVA